MSSTAATAKDAPSSRAERYAAGKALRAAILRDGHAAYEVSSKRDPVAILAESDPHRIQALVPIRYQRMAVSPFTFLRGAAAVMATDLARLPQVGIPVQACGDCHLMNFGAFATPEGRVLFDINDFDETLPGVDFTVDLKRLVASVAVAALDAGMPDKKAKYIAKATAKAYRAFMLELASLTPLEVWHVSMNLNREAKRIEDAKLRAKILGILVKAEKDLQADDNFPHMATTEQGEARIQDRPPLIYHFDTHANPDRIDIKSLFTRYRRTLLPERRALAERYELSDTAFKVVGVGSVGTFCAVALYTTPDQEHLFLQFKEAMASVLEKIVPAPAALRHQGRRVVEGQRAMQAASDIFLGWAEDRRSKRHFYIRQLKNRRLGSIGEVIETSALEAYAALCGRTLARAHARTGDPVLIAGYMGKSSAFDEALAVFAMAYAEQTKRDHARLLAAMPKAEAPAAVRAAA